METLDPMEKMPSESLAVGIKDSSKRRRALLLLGLALVVLIGLQVRLALPHQEPASNGVRLSEWLGSDHAADFDLTRPSSVELMKGFGPEAIPLLIEAFRNAGSSRSLILRWTDDRQRRQLRPQEIRERVLTALVALAQEHPDQVDPFVQDLLASSDRVVAIPFLAYLGPRYLSALMNIIATGDQREVPLAVDALMNLGAQGRVGVPVLLERLKQDWARGRPVSSATGLIDEVGPLSRNETQILVAGLSSTNRQVFNGSAVCLQRMPHVHTEVADKLLSQAQVANSNHTVAVFSISFARNFGAPRDVVAALARDRIATLLKGPLDIPRYQQLYSCSQTIVACRDVEGVQTVVDERVLPLLREHSDPALVPDRMRNLIARRISEQIEEMIIRWEIPLEK